MDGSSTKLIRFCSAAIFSQTPGTCLFLIFYIQSTTLVKPDRLAPRYSWCSFERGDILQIRVFCEIARNGLCHYSQFTFFRFK